MKDERLDLTELVAAQQGRYHRQELIPWWDQTIVSRARVLVLGVGALGNEILKLLALTGVGNILAYDMDRIEASNLNRSVLFRAEDLGCLKVEAAIRRLAAINPDVRVHGHGDNIVHGAGLGVFLWADVVICGLDNRLARVFVNSASARTGRAWVDGAIEGLDGTVRTFRPSRSPCYECTMNNTDRTLLAERRSCSMLMRDAVSRGHAPNTSVTASLVASLQVMEALKLLHGQPTLEGEGLHINGLVSEFNRVSYQRRDHCLGHQVYPQVSPLGLRSTDVTLRELLERAEREFGAGTELELSREVVSELECPECDCRQWAGSVLGTLTQREARCPECSTHRVAHFVSSIRRDADFDLNKTPAELGLPPFDIIAVRNGLEEKTAWLFDGDGPQILGLLERHMEPERFKTRDR